MVENYVSATIEKHRAKGMKAEIYLRYSLLVDLMEIVKQHGQYNEYDFNSDKKLEFIKSNVWNNHIYNKKTRQILSIDSFTTIWLITLPEKFQEWFENHKKPNNANLKETLVMTLKESPSFPIFVHFNVSTKLPPSPYTKSYKLLPDTWNLMNCFKSFYDQNEKWTSKSINAEFEAFLNVEKRGLQNQMKHLPLFMRMKK